MPIASIKYPGSNIDKSHKGGTGFTDSIILQQMIDYFGNIYGTSVWTVNDRNVANDETLEEQIAADGGRQAFPNYDTEDDKEEVEKDLWVTKGGEFLTIRIRDTMLILVAVMVIVDEANKLTKKSQKEHTKRLCCGRQN
jgi:hypothetical protein